MKRLVSVLSLVAFLGISGLSANGFDSSKIASKFTQADSNFLFGTNNIENLNVQMLSKQEMQETRGMLNPFLIHMGIGFAYGFGDSVLDDYLNDLPIDWQHAIYSGMEEAAFEALVGSAWKGGKIIWEYIRRK